MKNILILSIFTFFAVAASAQQEHQFTQFMLNKLNYNPGYAGSFQSPTVSAYYRSQWIGLEGAPTTQAISYNMPLLNERVGLGGNLVRNSIGINKSTTLDVSYAYRLPLWYGHLGIGIQASARHFRQDWADQRLVGSQPIETDNAIPNEPKNKLVPNFGIGLYYQTEKYYVGVSIPRLVNNNIDFAEQGGILSREARHYYLMSGMNFQVNENTLITPQFLVKYVTNAPLSADINVNFQLQKRFLTGITYRSGNGQVSAAGESLDILMGVQATAGLYLGLSYDIGLTKLWKQSAGSLEATVRYWINPPSGDVIVDPLAK